MISGAEFSECRKFRYALWRLWNDKPYVMFIGLNPSTANETKNDATIRRVITISYNLGYGGIYMMNCFPFISTNPDLLRLVNIEENDKWLKEIGAICKDVIFSWGNFDIVKDAGRDKDLAKLFPEAKALIINKDGSPRHPLYVPSNTIPVHYQSKINQVNKAA